MFTTPSTDYITATKLIESFSSFFDKINSISTDSALNAQKLTDIKKILYSNIHSQQNILNATHDLCTRRPEELRSTPRPITIYSPRPEQSQKIETSEFSVSQNYFSVPGTEQRQIANQEGYSEEKTHLNTEYLPATSFLALVRAACHNDMSKLFSLSLNYAYIRTFSDNREPVFTALCFAFLEKIARQKGKDSQFYLTQGYHQRKFRETGSNSARETEFLDFFKIFCQTNSNESDISKRFYESVMGNPGFYQSALSIFKHHIKRVVSGRPQDIGSGDEESFEWMNDLDEIEDVSYFQGLTQVFKKSIKFLILTRTRLVEKAFYYENYGYSMPQSDTNSKNELTVFFDKVSRTSFILYPNDKPIEEDLDVSFSQRSKVKANTATPNINVKPPLNNDLLKSQKSFGLEQAHGNGSLSTLDTASGNTLTSLNELENKDRQKTGPASRPQVLKKAGTLNVVTSSLNECGSPSFTYPESAQIRPNTEKVYYMGFHSASKDLGLYRLKTEEDVLMRKDREPTPSRPSTTHRHFESPGFGDRTFTEVSGRLDFSRQALNTLGDEYKESRDVSFLEKSPIKECVNLRAYMSETKDKSDHFYGRGAAVEMYSQRNSHVRGYEAPMVNVAKPMALPILLKNKIDKFNQSVNQNDQELVGTVGKYLKSEGRSGERSQGLRDIMGMYQMIVDRTEDNSRRSNFGVMMRMDV